MKYSRVKELEENELIMIKKIIIINKLIILKVSNIIGFSKRLSNYCYIS